MIVLLIFLVGILSGCVGVNVREYAFVEAADRCVVDSVWVRGPMYRDSRLASRSVGSNYEYSTGNLSFNSPYGSSSLSSSNQFNSISSSSTYERFNNPYLQKAFVRILEDAKLAKRVYTAAISQASKANCRLDLEVYETSTTGLTKVGWNILNSVLMFSFLPTPFLGDSSVQIEARAYVGDTFIKSYQAEVAVSWTLPGLWGLASSRSKARSRCLREAGKVALHKLAQQIAEDPPGAAAALSRQ